MGMRSTSTWSLLRGLGSIFSSKVACILGLFCVATVAWNLQLARWAQHVRGGRGGQAAEVDGGVATSNGAVTCHSVALVVSGELRDGLKPEVLSSQHFLVESLQRCGAGAGTGKDQTTNQVHLYVCVDRPNAAKMEAVRFGTLKPMAVWEHDASDQRQRLRKCIVDVRSFAQAKGLWRQYSWFVRSRPDLLFFAQV